MHYRLHEKISDEYAINCDQLDQFIYFNIFLFNFISSFADIFFSNFQKIWHNLACCRTICYNFFIFTYKFGSFGGLYLFHVFVTRKLWVTETILAQYVFLTTERDYNLRSNYRKWEAHWFFLLISMLLIRQYQSF